MIQRQNRQCLLRESGELRIQFLNIITLFLTVLGCSVFGPYAIAQIDPDAIYQLGTDSNPQDAVPEGKIVSGNWTSTIFDGTNREYSVYVPAQYDGRQPACLMVFQDGHAYLDKNGQFRVPVVFDNLIHKGELPVTICVFVNPGHKGETVPENRWSSNNRSIEYDTLSDKYARFLQLELIPHITTDLNLNISADPQDRAICGISSGGICAFTVAWEHPEWFSKVLSHVGSFTNIRGGHNYEAMIRKTPPKPIRVFLQDGSNDLDNEHGNWWLANLAMESSLKFRNYDHRFEGGTGGHNGKHGGAILPDSLRWLWRDHVGAAVQDPNSPSAKIDIEKTYERRSIRYTGGEYKDEEFEYRIMKPAPIADGKPEEAGKKYPLLVFLHGAGERGTDNSLQLLYLPSLMASPLWRERYQCYVLAPQCRPDRKWVNSDWSAPTDPVMAESPTDQIAAVMQMIDQTIADEQIDVSRIYVTGLSMGGFGSWDLALRQPDRFAAVAPICGGVDCSRLTVLKSVPVWIAHGDDDTVVPVDRSRNAYKALTEIGAKVTYVELSGVGHNSWTPTFTDPDGMVPWLFRQKR